MSFLRNPFQSKYIPVLICMVLGVAAFAITHGPMALFVMGMLGFLNYVAAGQPLHPAMFHGYIVLSGAFFAFGIFSLFVAAWGAAIVSVSAGALPLSIVLTRKVS